MPKISAFDDITHVHVPGLTMSGRRYILEDGSEITVCASVKNPPAIEMSGEANYEAWLLALESDAFKLVRKALNTIETEASAAYGQKRTPPS